MHNYVLPPTVFTAAAQTLTAIVITYVVTVIGNEAGVTAAVDIVAYISDN